MNLSGRRATPGQFLPGSPPARPARNRRCSWKRQSNGRRVTLRFRRYESVFPGEAEAPGSTDSAIRAKFYVLSTGKRIRSRHTPETSQLNRTSNLFAQDNECRAGHRRGDFCSDISFSVPNLAGRWVRQGVVVPLALFVLLTLRRLAVEAQYGEHRSGVRRGDRPPPIGRWGGFTSGGLIAGMRLVWAI
jgi:hypothetical protein